MDLNNNTIYAVDFDGTLSLGAAWPEIGEPNLVLFDFLIKEKAAGARVILWSCRKGKELEAAVNYCKYHGLTFDTVNENLPELIEAYGGDTRKINADVYIDDRAIKPFAIDELCGTRGYRPPAAAVEVAYGSRTEGE